MDYLEILVRLRKIIRSINLESKRIEKNFGVSIPQLLCLKFLNDQPEFKARAVEIKGFLNLNASTISGILSRLESKGLIAKLPKMNDRRATFVTLTQKGADLLQKSPTTLQEKLSRRLERLSDDRTAVLLENIDLLVELLDASELDASPLVTIQDIQPDKKTST